MKDAVKPQGMWKARTRRHCSDADLLALLDGELSRPARWRAKAHVYGCWECRARRAQLETQAHRFALALREETFPGPHRIAQSKAEFLAWRSGFDRSHAAPPSAGRLALTRRAAFALSLAATAMAATGAWAYLGLLRETPVEPPPLAGPLFTASDPIPTRPFSPPVSRSRPGYPLLPSPPRLEMSVPAHPALNLHALEIEVHYRLHRIRACARGTLEVTVAADGSVRVEGMVGAAERKASIIAVLQDLQEAGSVRLNVRSAEEMAAEPVLPDSAVRAGAQIAGRSHVDSILSPYFDSPAELTRAAHLVTGYAETAHAESWALRRLMSLAERTRPARGPSYWLLERMFRDHRTALESALAEARRTAGPALDRMAGQARGEHPAASAHGRTDLFAAVEEATDLIHRIFAAAEEEKFDAVSAAARLAALLHSAELELHRLESRWANDFGHGLPEQSY